MRTTYRQDRPTMTVDDAASNTPRAMSMVSWERKYCTKATAPCTVLHRSRLICRGPINPYLRRNLLMPAHALLSQRYEATPTYAVRASRGKHRSVAMRYM